MGVTNTVHTDGPHVHSIINLYRTYAHAPAEVTKEKCF